MNQSPKNLEDSITILDALTNHFNISEIRTLCLEMGVDFDELPGETKSDKARELIIFLSNRKRLLELSDIIRQHRPTITLRQKYNNSLFSPDKKFSHRRFSIIIIGLIVVIPLALIATNYFFDQTQHKLQNNPERPKTSTVTATEQRDETPAITNTEQPETSTATATEKRDETPITNSQDLPQIRHGIAFVTPVMVIFSWEPIGELSPNMSYALRIRKSETNLFQSYVGTKETEYLLEIGEFIFEESEGEYDWQILIVQETEEKDNVTIFSSPIYTFSIQDYTPPTINSPPQISP